MGQISDRIHQSGHHDRNIQDLQGAPCSVKASLEIVEIFSLLQVELKVEEVKPRLDKAGNIRKNDFIEFSIECKLLDLTERKTNAETPKKGPKVSSERRRESPGPGLLCCLPARKQEKKDTTMDRVEAAFRKFDSDGDGYIDWEEFKQVRGSSVLAISIIQSLYVK